jgi:ABC-2 type transport system ATP-binding protein
MSDKAIEVKNVLKTFKIPLDKGKSLKQAVLGKGSRGYKTITPLNKISFDVPKGQFFGIVGRNGSGKSTLLKTIAGIYHPTSGAVKLHGSLVPFIELGVGFNPQLTGRENVYLNCALLGFARKEIDSMYQDIVDFAELEDFMDERLQNYSSGMQVRLAFSISIRAHGDILLLDEVLAVGDYAFRKKCFKYFEQLKRDKKTVVLVTHSMKNVEEFCERAILLEKGDIIFEGSGEEVAQKYEEMFVS